MGVTAAVVGDRGWSERQSGLGQCDELLVAGVRAGDRAAFEEIYDRYARGILAFCVQMLGNREAAEDALQLTFVSAYRALQGGESSIALRPWLYTIARNRCLSELRARREAAGVIELVTHAPVIEGLADQVQRREDLREMLDDMRRLPADQRAALVLFELGDHPQKEIATVLGVRTEKVKALVFQAREALVRGRAAREHPCHDIREQLATLEGRIPARSVLRAHIERCAGCQSFEHEVRHQRAALALILPVALTGELKSWILGSALHSGRAVAAGVGACGGGGVAAGACGGGAVVGGATAVSGMGGAGGAISAATAGGIAASGAGTAAIATSAPVVAAATGLTAVGESIGGLSATGVMAKILTAAAIATVAASSSHNDKPIPHPGPVAKARHNLLASAVPLAGVRAPARAGGTATGVPLSVTATPLGSPTSAPSSTPVTSSGATSAATSSTSGTGTTSAAGGAEGNGPASTAPTSNAAPTSGGGSGSATAPADPSSGTTPAASSGSSGTTASSTSSAPAATDPSSSLTTDQSATTAAATAPPADSSGGGDASGSPPSTSAAGTATTQSADTTAASSGTSSAGATAPSTSTAAAPLSATAAAPGDASNSSGPAGSASSAATSGS